ncbi:MAG: cytochrome b N-terminal domain-containing protein [Acidobacteriota bacterium]|nr:cytochrome b N-terminal domain-containing protein [Blastocatellia bacterium]MDW8239101.1 cytochrome b N-terminal domain-containing protein [Acidobacteriota bacterium]
MVQRVRRNGLFGVLKDLPRNIWDSIFRHPLPSSDLGRAQTSFTNFFLHIHPVKVHRHTLRPTYTFGLGLISFFLFLILTVTGILLMFYYVPSTTQAYDRMLDLRGSVAFGTFLRNMHRWSAHGMVAAVFLHMCRVFFTGSYQSPREFNWVIGVLLFLVTLFMSFTGYLLPWDQLAFWAITVGTSIAAYAPVFGQEIRFLLLGDNTVGQEALLRFYVLHVAVLPLILSLLVAVHFWRIRKDGGLSRPPEADTELFESQAQTDEPVREIEPASATLAAGVGAPVGDTTTGMMGVVKRRYGIQGLVRGPFTTIGNVPDNSVFSWPHLFMAELFVFVLTVAGVLVVSFFFAAPLEEPVNVQHPPNPAKAPWYFLGLQEMVSYSAFWGGVGIPTIEVLILLLVPYIDRRVRGVGRWFARERLLPNTLFLIFALTNVILIIIGTFFRGPNWEFVSPW